MNHRPAPEGLPDSSRHAVLADLDAVVPAYGAALQDEAVAAWMLPDEERRSRLADTAGFGRYVRELLEAGVLVVAESDGIAGVSVWLHDDGSEADDEEDPDSAQTALLQEIYGEHADRVLQVAALAAQRHPRGEPHFYLQQMAVLPAYRGRGLGGSMLRRGLAIADSRGLPAHLEASTPRNHALYARYGFADSGPTIDLPEGGPRLQPMRRDARA